MDTTVVHVDTSTRSVADLTDVAADFCRDRGDGLLHIFARHVRNDEASPPFRQHAWRQLTRLPDQGGSADPNPDNPQRQVRLSFVSA